jgi:hypothetical protein
MQQIGTFEGVQHSRCVQARISEPTEAAAIFNRSGTPDICLVAVPKAPFLCCQFASIPSGFFVLYQRWYQNQGSLDPGFKFCWPFWYRVSHVVNRATITYSAPSRQVPTADNVMVDINLSLTFAIGPSFDDAVAFVYLLGCTRFDEFLAAEVEEGIRGLVYSVTHDRVNDLREEFAQNMLASLSNKFRPFGVQIKNVKVTETRLPRHLAESLEQTTTFKTRISEVAKKHENTIRVLQDEASQELEQVLRVNARRKQDLLAQCTRYEIEHKEIIDEMVGQARVQEMEAKSKIDVLITQAKGNLEVAKAEGEKEAEEIRRKMQIKCEERRIKVDQMANSIVLASESVLRASENNSKALVASAESENNSTAGLEVKRKYELEWERLKIMEIIAKDGRRFVTGEVGKNLLKDMIPTQSVQFGRK